MVDREGQSDGRDDAPSAQPLVRERYDWSVTPPSLAILTALSRLEDDDPLDAAEDGARLHDYVDPDALDALVTHEPGGAPTVSVRIDGYLVRIEDNEVSVTRSDRQASPSEA